MMMIDDGPCRPMQITHHMGNSLDPEVRIRLMLSPLTFVVWLFVDSGTRVYNKK